MRKIVGFLILTICMLALLSVVASAEETVDLLAGQETEAGTVTVSYDGDNLCFIYETVDGWELVETHFTIAELAEEIPQTKKGNPKVGHFLYGDDELGIYEMIEDISVLVGGVDSYGDCIELDLDPGTYFVAAQASLLNTDIIIDYVPDTGDPEDPDDPGAPIYQQETGWGDGDEFADDRNWAMYFTFTVTEED